eukprot:6185854-Pleurochrysis_carterae.AAC.3
MHAQTKFEPCERGKAQTRKPTQFGSVRRDSAGLAETWENFPKFQRMFWELPQLVVQNMGYPKPGSADCSPEHDRPFTARTRPTQSATIGRTLNKPLKIRIRPNPL